MSTIVQSAQCQVCGHFGSAGAAEYHPHEFCRIYKVGGDPWRGICKPVTIHEMTPALKKRLQDRCRRFWRGYYSTEVKLP